MAGENRQEKKALGATYATAMYDLASEQGVLETVRDELYAWREILKREPKLSELFDSPLIPAEDREKLLRDLGQGSHPLVMNFLNTLNARGRLGILSEVIQAFSEEDDRRNNRVRVKVTTAVAVDGHLMDDLRKILRKYLNQEPIMEQRVDPEIIGGFIAHAGDLLIDGSVRTRIKALEAKLLTRGEDEIQSRRDFIGN